MAVETPYYRAFENRRPEYVAGASPFRTALFRFFSLIYLGVGISYLRWRYTESINPDALIFSMTLWWAEVLMFIGGVLMIINHWNSRQLRVRKPVRLLSQIEQNIKSDQDRLISIDLFIATYNEPLNVVEDTIIDALRARYIHKDVVIKYYLCDDGQRDGRDTSRENFLELANRYGIHYLCRENNKGFKAGNLNHAFWQTDGDLIVILDADTRLFPEFLNRMTGYFRNPKMAWVQSPQWFYDIPDGISVRDAILARNPKRGKVLSALIPFSRSIRVSSDLLGTDPTIFYQVILYHRNAANASFCCGAGSIHRRKALESLIQNQLETLQRMHSSVPLSNQAVVHKELLRYCGNEAVGPFAHHVSEDICTSILTHSDPAKWESYQHPVPECRMLSPQSLEAYIKQFSRYAEGTFSIFFSRINPLIKKGLSIWQRLAYAETLYSYFSPIWICVFLLSPIIFYFSLIPPLKAFSFDFFLRLLVLNVVSQILATTLHWGISTKRSEQYYVAGFWLKLTALVKVLSGREIRFNTTSKRTEHRSFRQNLRFVWPHLLLIFLTVAGLIYNLWLIWINRHPSYSAFWANNIWASYNLYQISPMIRAAFKT